MLDIKKCTDSTMTYSIQTVLCVRSHAGTGNDAPECKFPDSDNVCDWQSADRSQHLARPSQVSDTVYQISTTWVTQFIV